jgi:hypothetical protein
MASRKPLIMFGGFVREIAAGDELSAPNVFHSSSGGFRFPDNSLQTAAAAPGANNVGYLNIPQNLQNASYTLVLADAGKHIRHTDATARTMTIPANASVAFTIGTSITFSNGNGAGVMTIAITTDVMRLAGAGTTGSRTLAANGIATAVKVAAAEWQISGTGLT